MISQTPPASTALTAAFPSAKRSARSSTKCRAVCSSVFNRASQDGASASGREGIDLSVAFRFAGNSQAFEAKREEGTGAVGAHNDVRSLSTRCPAWLQQLWRALT